MTTVVDTTKSIELRNRMNAKRDVLDGIFSEAGGPSGDYGRVKSIRGGKESVKSYVKGEIAELYRMGAELTDMTSKSKMEGDFRRMDSFLNSPIDRPDMPGGQAAGMSRKSLGSQFIESGALKSYRGGAGETKQFDINTPNLKALFGGGLWSGDAGSGYSVQASGFEPETDRIGRVVLSAQRPPQLIDILPQFPTDQISIPFMEEAVFNNTAAPTAADSTARTVTDVPSAPEVDIRFTERQQPVQPVSGLLPITTDVLADEPQVRALVDSRLMFMLDQSLDRQCTVGSDIAPNLRGLTAYQTIAQGVDLTPGQSQMLSVNRGSLTQMDTVYHAITEVRTRGYANPTHIVMHPNDYLPIRLARGDDNYLLAGPTVGAQLGLWGLPIVENAALPEGVAFVGDFTMYAGLYFRQQAELQISDSHSDWFGKSVLAIRGRLRACLVIFRPTAFCRINGLNS